MSKGEILITGLGSISAAGETCSQALSSFKAANRNHSSISLFKTDIDKPVFEVQNIPEKHLRPGMRTVALALSAVEEALSDAKLNDTAGLKVGVCFGTTVASQLNDMDFYRAYRATGKGPKEAITRYLESNLASAIKKEFGFTGPELVIVNACSSGTDAVGTVCEWLNSGMCDIAIAGGADELNHVPVAGFNSLSILSNNPCAPFDRDRTGLNLGEGAGALVLETAETAKKRGVSSSLSCLGYGTYADAYHLTAPRPDGSGLENAVRKALKDAGRKASDISFVNAHGTATENNDLVEGNTLARIFGEDIKIYSTKGYTGHTLGAAGAIEAVFTCLALKEGWIPKSAGFENKDENIPLAPVSELTEITGNCALSTSLAFGGNNSAIILGYSR